MNLQEFFEKNPKATLLQVGKKYFLSSAREKAEHQARMTNKKVVELTAESLTKKK